MKIRNKILKNWVFHRIQVITNLCFHCATFEVDKYWYKQLLGRNKFYTHKSVKKYISNDCSLIILDWFLLTLFFCCRRVIFLKIFYSFHLSNRLQMMMHIRLSDIKFIQILSLPFRVTAALRSTILDSK